MGVRADEVHSARVNDSLGIAPSSIASKGRSVPVALWFGGGTQLNRPFEEREVSLLNELHGHGIDVVLAGLCGTGDTLWKGGLWDFAPLLLGKTHISLHADEMLKIVAWALSVLKATSVVLIAIEDTAATV